jgi:putative transcriptional regulator
MNWFKKEVGQNIKALRMKAGYSQEQLAQLLDLSRVSVMNIERGRHTPPLSGIYTICCLFGCTWNDVMPEIKRVDMKTKTKVVIKKKLVKTFKPVKVI